MPCKVARREGVCQVYYYNARTYFSKGYHFSYPDELPHIPHLFSKNIIIVDRSLLPQPKSHAHGILWR